MDLINNNKRSIIFVGILFISLLFPISFLIGTIAGVMVTTYIFNKLVCTGKLNLLIFNIGKWEVHVHHWVSGMLLFATIYFLGIFPDLSYFWIGGLVGMIIHDLYTDEIWYKVVYRNEED